MAFWIAIALVVFIPGSFGFIIGRIIEAVYGIASKALKATVSAVQKARKNGADLNNALASEQDSDVKNYITNLKKKENIK
jgi:hypothetical protein